MSHTEMTLKLSLKDCPLLDSLAFLRGEKAQQAKPLTMGLFDGYKLYNNIYNNQTVKSWSLEGCADAWGMKAVEALSIFHTFLQKDVIQIELGHEGGLNKRQQEEAGGVSFGPFTWRAVCILALVFKINSNIMRVRHSSASPPGDLSLLMNFWVFPHFCHHRGIQTCLCLCYSWPISAQDLVPMRFWKQPI